MAKREVTCAVLGCENVLTEGQRGRKMAVCSRCEEAGMHLCEVCGRRISVERIRDGATLCKECEVVPTDLEEIEKSEYWPGHESEGFMA